MHQGSDSGRVLCFGELLLRLSPSLQGKWISDAAMPVYIGGAELNVAQALSHWGMPVDYSTALPDNYLSKEIIDFIAAKNIGNRGVLFRGERIGTYYLPSGADLKNAGVIYDRAHSSFAGLKPGMINWDDVLNDKSWFHFSAISPALNEDVAAVCLEAAQAAGKKGLTVSIDLNYRAKLWQYGKKPMDVMPALVEHCDVIMGNAWAAESLLGIASPLKESVGVSHATLEQGAYESMTAVRARFPRARCLAYTFRLEKEYFAVIDNEKQRARSVAFSMADAVDRVGSGDCFMAALIYGLIKKHQAGDIIDFAAAAAVGKLYEKGDATRQTLADIQQRLQQQKISG